MINTKGIVAICSLFLLWGAISPAVEAKHKPQHKPQHKAFINQLKYSGINFKVDESYNDVEFKVGKFTRVDGISDEFTQQINSKRFLKKITRIHAGKPYKELRTKRQFAKNKGQRVPKIENWYRIPVTKKMTEQDILEIYNTLVELSFISNVELETPPVSAIREQCPAIDCGGDRPGGGGTSTPTPNLQSYQTYLGPSPYGIDANYAWTRTGGNGAGVKIIDMEGGYNSSHEDLPSSFVRINDANNNDHGTAVMSVVGAKNDNKGMKGIAYASQLGFYGWGSSTSQSIRKAGDKLSAGDVLILEGQINRDINSGDTCTSANQDECVPLEWSQANYDAIAYTVSRGVIVIEAAGNGNENLDSSIYNNRFNRNSRDSGAFLIAATHKSSSISRSSFSNHGSRIDFNAWGDGVASAGLYGSTLFDGGTNRRYGSGFSGTSSASPIVAGAVASLQGFSKQSKGVTLSVNTIRSILTNTGVQEPSGVQVGVRPNLKTAIAYLDGNPVLAPPKASAFWDACYGSNEMSWSSVAAATSYKIYVNGSYWATTTSTRKHMNVSSSKSAYVKACKGAECSTASNSVALRYAPACY